MPPKIANIVNNGCRRTREEINLAAKTLSISAILAQAQIIKPIAAPVCPVPYKNIIAGAQTREVPKVGTNAATNIADDHNNAFGKPKIVKPTNDAAEIARTTKN
jgi:hypothetical protein